MTQETQTAQADMASVPLDPFRVSEAVQAEISSRFERVRALLDEIIDWSHSTKHLPEAEVNTVNDARLTLVEVSGAFNDRTNAPQAEPLMVGRG